MEPGNLDYAKHLFDEWKYRHEMFFKLLFRYSWIYIVAAVLPSLATESPIGAEFFQQVRSGTRTSVVYWGFVVVFFIASHFHLVFEYRRTEAIRNKLRVLRNESKEGEKLAFREFASKLPHEIVYLSAFILFFILCWRYQHGQSAQPAKSTPAAKSVCVPVCEPSVDSQRPAEPKRR